MSDELKERVGRVLREEAAPALEMDGTAIEVVDVSDGVVQLRLHGACSGCPASVMVLIRGLEDELRRRVPEVDYLEALP